MNITKEDTQQAIQWFEPVVSEVSMYSVHINMKDMPREHDLESKISHYNMHRMSGIKLTSNSPQFKIQDVALPEVLTHVIRNYLHPTPVDYSIFKTIWIASYIDQLRMFERQTRFDMAYYEEGSEYCIWSHYRIKQINNMISTLIDDIPVS